MAKEKDIIRNNDIAKAIGIPALNIPKYSKSVINNANGYARATRPENVSQVSETIKVFRQDNNVTKHSLEEWEKWYNKKYPEAISKATDEAWIKFSEVLDNLKTVTKEDIAAWEKDLIIYKTYTGLMIQDAIIKDIAKKMRVESRLATVEEESMGIDGYINNKPVQIKARTYESNHNERFDKHIIIVYYEKDARTSDISYEYNPDDFR